MMPLTFVQDGEHPRRRSFVAAYAERHGHGPMPSPMSAAQGYDAMRILLNALQSATGEKGPEIRAALENMTSRIEGVITIHSHPFTREDHDAITPNMLVMGVVRNGKADYAFKEDANRSFLVERKR